MDFTARRVVLSEMVTYVRVCMLQLRMCVHSSSSHFPSCLSCHFLLSDLRSLALALDSEALVGTSLLITLRNFLH